MEKHMGSEQITSIAIKVGELSQTANIAIWVAGISALAAIIAAILAGYFKWKLNELDKKHQKQWAYMAKRSQLIDAATEVFPRMLYNKLLIAHNNNPQAAHNLFELQKDVLVIESQLVVYASQELADAVFEYKNLIVNMPNEEFLKKWGEIYKKGNEYLVLCRKYLGNDVSEKFEDFAKKLIEEPVVEQSATLTVSANTMGSVTITPKNPII
jgi:hypothetical protein